MVRFAREHGIKPTARAFAVNRNTVRKWLRRYQKDSMGGLMDRSKAPHYPHSPIKPEQRLRVIELKKKLPSWGARRIKANFGLPLSEKAIRKIWHHQGLLRRKRKKHKTKHDLRAVKAHWRVFEQVDIDTKDLGDIPELWPQIRRLNLPKIQYTARDVVSGLQVLAYAQERSLNCASLFAQRIIDHLRSCRVQLKHCRFQTDNGAEFIGAWNARSPSLFTLVVESVPGLQHHTIPPRAHTYQADVETAHRLIEDEFYEVETFSSRQDFLQKATAYTLWFNVARPNSYKSDKTPWQIIHERDPTISPRVAILSPVFLDEIYNKNLDNRSKGGYHPIPHPSFLLYTLVTPSVFNRASGFLKREACICLERTSIRAGFSLPDTRCCIRPKAIREAPG
jgi:transposase